MNQEFSQRVGRFFSRMCDQSATWLLDGGNYDPNDAQFLMDIQGKRVTAETPDSKAVIGLVMALNWCIEPEDYRPGERLQDNPRARETLCLAAAWLDGSDRLQLCAQVRPFTRDATGLPINIEPAMPGNHHWSMTVAEAAARLLVEHLVERDPSALTAISTPAPSPTIH